MRDFHITGETWGFTIIIHHKSGGASGTWVRDFKELEEEYKSMFDLQRGSTHVTFIPRQYKDRMSPW
jgi:hypothetical protein